MSIESKIEVQELAEKPKDSRSGQTAVELILMISLVSGVMIAITPIFDAELAKVVDKIVTAVKTVGWTGGYKTVSETDPLGAHYDGSQATMSKH